MLGGFLAQSAMWESQNPENPDKRAIPTCTMCHFFINVHGGRPYQAPALIEEYRHNKITAPPDFPPVVHLEFCFGFTK